MFLYKQFNNINQSLRKTRILIQFFNKGEYFMASANQTIQFDTPSN